MNNQLLLVLVLGLLASLFCQARSADYFSVRDFGAVGDGITDDSGPFQAAIDAAFLAGGGVVFVPGAPEGWRLERPLLVRPDVTLKGIHAGPADAAFLAVHDAGQDAPKAVPYRPIAGGLLLAQADYPALTLAHNSGVDGLTFVYPDQVPYTALPIKRYPPMLSVRGFGQQAQVPGIPRSEAITFDGPLSGRSVTIRNIGALNAYQLLEFVGENPPLRQIAQNTVDGLWGYPLSIGINIQNSLDTIVLRNLQFRPTFFHPACGEISKTALGLVLGKSDGLFLSDVLVFGLAVGILHKAEKGSLGAFSVRASNVNLEALIPVWFDSQAVDDQVQYDNSFIFHTQFGFTPKPDDVYSRAGHTLLPELSFTPADFCTVRVSNTCERDTFQSYIRFVGCGFHPKGGGPVCRVEGNRLVRVLIASSNLVYFRRAVLEAASGAQVLATITGNDLLCWSTDLSQGDKTPATHLIDFSEAGSTARAIFNSNMLHGSHPALMEELEKDPRIVAEGNCAL